ncbi:unnamed protein product, partial [Discosporangium mesarthrocarpum]
KVLSWEFSFVEAWQIPPAQQLIRPGPRWRQYLVRPDFLGAVFSVYQRVRVRGRIGAGPGATLPHALRQLLLQLSSVHGDIFQDELHRQAYASFLVEGAASVLANPLLPAGGTGGEGGGAPGPLKDAQLEEYVGIASMAVRLIANFKLRTLAHLPSFTGFVHQLSGLTSAVLQD